MKRGKDRYPVRDLQEVCKDILTYRIRVDDRDYWHGRLGKLSGRYLCGGVNSFSTTILSNILSRLQRTGLIHREMVKWHSPLRSSLPEVFFKEGSANYIYIIDREEELRVLASSSDSAAEFMNLKTSLDTLQFADALSRVREEIENSSDPHLTFVGVLKKLMPK